MRHPFLETPLNTFNLPDGYLDKRVSIPEAWEHHFRHSAEHPLFVYEDTPGDIRTVTWGLAGRVVHRSARIVQSYAKRYGQPIEDPTKPPIIGILAATDSFTYWAVVTGIIRAGYQCFTISPRNSPLALAHLLKITGCEILFVSSDNATQTLYRDTLVSLERDVAVADMPDSKELYMDDDRDFEPLPAFELQSLETPCLMAHSSGSTNFPKPISITHKGMIDMSLFPYTAPFGNHQMTGKVGSLHVLPLYHIMGLIYTIMLPASVGVTVSIFKPSNPPIKPTPESVLAATVATKCELMLIVPTFVEIWSNSPEAISALKTLPNLKITYGGGPLSPEAGKTMIKNGIDIVTVYGSTELGVIHNNSSLFLGNDEDWLYFEINTLLDCRLEPFGAGLFKLVVVANSIYAPNVSNCEVDGKPAFDTNDLLAPHPSAKGWWKVYGRADDQIMHSTGEKTNPGPLERIIKQHHAVQTCLMFGRGEFHAGIIIEPVQGETFDPKDQERLAQFRNQIWPVVEEANLFAPQHSRVFKEMVVVTHPGKPLLMTDKGTIKRQPNLDIYADDIKAAYDGFEHSFYQDIPTPTSWSVDNSTGFVRDVITTVLAKSVAFKRHRYAIQSYALYEIAEGTSNFGEKNLVYLHSTVASLGRFISEFAPNDIQRDVEGAIVEMEAMVQEFTQNFPAHVPSKPTPNTEVILVTGTTGSLGTHLLEKLAATPSVSRVYAFNRRDRLGENSLHDRQKRALEEHGVDSSILDSRKIVLLEGDTASPDLDLSKEIYEEVVGSVTSIIHNAWRVDFNLSLSSFQPLVRGVRNLINLSLASSFPTPPPIVFTSSISTVLNWSKHGAISEHVLKDPRIAVGQGYGESKWVSERILDIANERTSLQNVVIRVGQLSGNTRNGSWNIWEWFPAIVQSYKIPECLPGSRNVITWVPTDAAAAAIVDMRVSKWPFLHLVHPNPVPWSSVVTPIAKVLNVPIVPYGDWLLRLQSFADESTNVDPTRQTVAEHPALRLVEFIEAVLNDNMVDPESEAFVRTRLETKETVKVSKTMTELAPLSEEGVRRWLSYWKRNGVLSF